MYFTTCIRHIRERDREKSLERDRHCCERLGEEEAWRERRSEREVRNLWGGEGWREGGKSGGMERKREVRSLRVRGDGEKEGGEVHSKRLYG